jgi:hypothetical protein
LPGGGEVDGEHLIGLFTAWRRSIHTNAKAGVPEPAPGQGAQDQVEQIRDAQRAAREGRIKAVIDDIRKNEQRLQNILNSIRESREAHEDFD